MEFLCYLCLFSLRQGDFTRKGLNFLLSELGKSQRLKLYFSLWFSELGLVLCGCILFCTYSVSLNEVFQHFHFIFNKGIVHCIGKPSKLPVIFFLENFNKLRNMKLQENIKLCFKMVIFLAEVF